MCLTVSTMHLVRRTSFSGNIDYVTDHQARRVVRRWRSSPFKKHLDSLVAGCRRTRRFMCGARSLTLSAVLTSGTVSRPTTTSCRASTSRFPYGIHRSCLGRHDAGRGKHSGPQGLCPGDLQVVALASDLAWRRRRGQGLDYETAGQGRTVSGRG